MKSIVTFFLVTLLALTAAGALADELPLKKAGLWEQKVKMTIAGMPQPQEMKRQSCIDTESEKAAKAQGQQVIDKLGCPKADYRKTATGFVQDAVCKSDNGVTVTTHVEIIGDLNSSFKMKTTSHVEGKGAKMPDTSMEVEAKWLGACPVGFAPGTSKQVK